MPDTATPKTTRPARARTSAAKATVPAAKPVAKTTAPPVTEDDGTMRVTLVLEPQGETKSYAVFTPPAGSGCVGKFYAPLGTETVKVLLIGPAGSE